MRVELSRKQAVWAGLLLVGCSEQSVPLQSEIEEAQAASFLGSMDDFWGTDGWNGTFAHKRDQAYQFCFKRFREASVRSQCFDDQDRSLVEALKAEDYVARIQEHGLSTGDFEFGATSFEWSVYHQPELWSAAWNLCFSVYNEAGERDARMLGPCLTNAIGWDYFNVKGVP